MVDRRFSEIDLRQMLECARGLEKDVQEGRWVALTEHEGWRLEVIVEHDTEIERLAVVTAYRLA